MSTPEQQPDSKGAKTWSWPVPPSHVVFIHVYLFLMYCGLIAARMRRATDLFNNKTGMYYTDFVNIWSSARLTLTGRIMDVFNATHLFLYQQNLFGPKFHYQAEWFYPLHFMPLVLGLGALSYPAALGLWLSGTFVCYAVAVAWKQPLPLLLALVLFLAPSSYANIEFGQNGFLTAALLAGGLRALDRQPALAGALFGMLTFKPQLFVLAPVVLLAGRRCKALAFMVATTAALVAFSVAMFGVEPWLAYIHTTLPLHGKLLALPAVRPYFNMKVGITPFLSARLLDAPLGVAGAVAGYFGLVAVMAVVAAFHRQISPEHRAAIVLTATFLATPYALVYDMPSLGAAIVLFLAARRSRSLSLLEAAVCLVAWVLPLFSLYLNDSYLPITPLVVMAFLLLQMWGLKNAPRLEKDRLTPTG